MEPVGPTIKTGRVVAFDVDDTLVDWVPDGIEPPEGAVSVPWYAGGVQWVTVIQVHVECLKWHKRNGDTVLVWSQGGPEWTRDVVKTLGLNDFVDIVIGKPEVYYDDLHSSVWLTDRRHLPMKVGRIQSLSDLPKQDED